MDGVVMPRESTALKAICREFVCDSKVDHAYVKYIMPPRLLGGAHWLRGFPYSAIIAYMILKESGQPHVQFQRLTQTSG